MILIESTESADESFSELFRFRDGNQIRELLKGFCFPTGFICFPKRWCDIKNLFPGRSRSALQRAFYWFLDFMIHSWAYLLLYNHEYWLPHLYHCAEATRFETCYTS